MTDAPIPNWRAVFNIPIGKHVALDEVREKYFALAALNTDEAKGKELSAAIRKAASDLENAGRYSTNAIDGWYLVNDGHVPDPHFAQGYIVAVCRKQAHAEAVAKLLNYAGGNAQVREELGVTL